MLARRTSLAALMAAVALVLQTRSAAAANADSTAETFARVGGGDYRLPGAGECKAVVLLFIGHDCPVSNSYAPEIARLHKEFSARGVAFCAVYADADLEEKDARKHVKEYGIPCPAILDPKMTLALRVGATVKPEAAVLSPRGELLYRGRIDDWYADYGKRRDQPTRRELRDALEAILAGKPVPVTRTKAIGCDIDLPKRRDWGLGDDRSHPIPNHRTFLSASWAALRTAAFASLASFRSSDAADFASGPRWPSASAACRRTSNSASRRAAVRADTADFASGPIWPMARATFWRTPASELFSVSTNAGRAAFASGPCCARPNAPWICTFGSGSRSICSSSATLFPS